MDIYLKKAILHIVDRSSGDPLISQQELDLSKEYVRDYLTRKILKISSPQTKTGVLAEDSRFAMIAKDTTDHFVANSEKLLQLWYDAYKESEEAPSCDILLALYEEDTEMYLALLKINYNQGYTHLVEADETGMKNELILHQALLSNKTQKADEAITVNLAKLNYELIEKKYVFSGEKQFYFSTKVIESVPVPSLEENVKVIKRAAEKIGSKFENPKHDLVADVKEAIYEQVEETGQINPKEVSQKVFKENISAQMAFEAEIAEKGVESSVSLVKEAKAITEKKYGKQKLKLSNGIELIVPLEVYRNPDLIEFVNQPDGTISVMIKNVDEVINRI
ncbi:nucleoid-associated protein [Enterococcus sp. ALS3]|uniref:Nucleoid-associated protein n=1 Tax=Enterococcus alishanensis TaxID=1303817 RepID=A0ABS6T8N3_9ENTE|nr:nucleoid-associated protein [Enterococcus alishanensis]